jgi:hypothetical protein
MPLDLDVTGQGAGSVSKVLVARDRGTVVIDGETVRVTVHEAIPYPGTLIVYQGVGYTDAADTLNLVWFYCDAGALTQVYYESTKASGKFATASGQCIDGGAHGLITPFVSDFPALDIRLPHLSCGFSVTSPEQSGPGTLQLGDGPGLIADAIGQVRTALPFELLDCRTGCGEGQWFEMHVLLWDPNAGPYLGYGIMYFRPSDGGKTGTGAILGYQFNLSPFGERMNTTNYPDATWTFD